MSDRPDMTSMNVSLPSTQKEYVRERALATGCSTPSEYIRRLIHEDQKARAEERLEELVLEGLRSPMREIGPKEWAELREKLRAKFHGRTRRKAQ
jgi:antitoxin ParD1/3/4